jgi:hypothetical protein
LTFADGDTLNVQEDFETLRKLLVVNSAKRS